MVTIQQGVNIAGTPHRGTFPHRANTACNTTGLTLPAIQPPVNIWSSTSQLSTVAHSVFTAVTVLRRATLPLCSISPQRQCGHHVSGPQLRCSQLLTQANWSLPATYQHYSRAIAAPQPLVLLGHRTQVQARPDLVSATSTPLNIHSVLFRGSRIFKSGGHPIVRLVSLQIYDWTCIYKPAMLNLYFLYI